ncbi:RidA family protein [uncultured Bradyrhizobium sp.]|uniref:RidA family protein n=1 Tax=uncultured Bradyrhizobium sp. TaxID=199684 RepID=UPI00260FABD6|nr:RidA family protein [uncultured Bradyrhizobium sp.]
MTKQRLPTPQGRYVSARRHGDLIFVSGMTPRRNGKLVHVGQVVPGAMIEDYRAAVELATQNALQAAEATLGDGERIASALSLTVYINAPAGYAHHATIADFASRHLESCLPESPLPARAAVGVASLPGDAVVEVALVAAAAVNPESRRR